MEVFDFVVDQDGDLLFKGGDIALGESTLLHQRDLLLAYPGDFRQHPTIGVAIRRELNNTIGRDEIRSRIRREMEQDGQRIERLDVDGQGNIDIIAEYGEA